jgi:IS30 family transposase
MSPNERIVALIRSDIPLKSIAEAVGRHTASISRSIRKAGYSSMYVTEAERKQLLNQRRK